jgi:hypothetical protein
MPKEVGVGVAAEVEPAGVEAQAAQARAARAVPQAARPELELLAARPHRPPQGSARPERRVRPERQTASAQPAQFPDQHRASRGPRCRRRRVKRCRGLPICSTSRLGNSRQQRLPEAAGR